MLGGCKMKALMQVLILHPCTLNDRKPLFSRVKKMQILLVDITVKGEKGI